MRLFLSLLIILSGSILYAQSSFQEDHKIDIVWNGTKYYFNTGKPYPPIWHVEILVSNETDENSVIDFNNYSLIFDTDSFLRKLNMTGVEEIELKKGTAVTLTFEISFDENYPFKGSLAEKLNYINHFSFESICSLMDRKNGCITLVAKRSHETKYYDYYEMITLDD